ncbi:MAG TPA: hypothetical protein VM869_06280 [Enhygromyxa sp.]|nr:hypothetical protein [Enhygromyxa sp.]
MAGDDSEQADLDRAAILARRRRFIALAISGLATTGCKPSGPEVCLSIQVPEPESEQPPGSGPIVEDPGAPLETGETGETGGEVSGETGEALESTPPEVCLKVAPQPCLKKPPPRPCLMVY